MCFVASLGQQSKAPRHWGVRVVTILLWRWPESLWLQLFDRKWPDLCSVQRLFSGKHWKIYLYSLVLQITPTNHFLFSVKKQKRKPASENLLMNWRNQTRWVPGSEEPGLLTPWNHKTGAEHHHLHYTSRIKRQCARPCIQGRALFSPLTLTVKAQSRRYKRTKNPAKTASFSPTWERL